ncbi:hypothetical protein A2685_01925 [Candidatus Woesebacteria bacterium RIFCSPHIGHO2_01_FULL_37_10]|uniref:YoaR-like putative peptidoglycan binding domain-containing protein n=1 Tax=Candidatus Woesebacteria bacterium RIFCSPHIGHO2_01_FULL_37_10 TaxID=1802489 RepID=A0A1F7XWJ2_9BACT|nr:MAG: hypothetical protein A2685_01925 [Candidatus Woesebacteria bacterium RIFCSPHIGHO2_01_FULL_37_10]
MVKFNRDKISTINKKYFSKRGVVLILVSPIILFILLITLFNGLYYGKIFPGIYIADISVGGLSLDEATEKLRGSISMSNTLTLTSKNQNFEIPLSDLEFTYDYSGSAHKAYDIVRTGNFYIDQKERLELLYAGKNIKLQYKIKEDKLDEHLSIIAGQIATEPVLPSIKLVNGQIIIDKGSPGEDIEFEKLKMSILDNLTNGNNVSLQIPIAKIDKSLKQAEIDTLENKAKNLIGKNITLIIDNLSFNYKDADLIPLLLPDSNNTKLNELLTLLEKDVNRDSQNSTFVFQDGKVSEFTPSQDGLKVNKLSLKTLLLERIENLTTSEDTSSTIEIPVERVSPKITTAEVNNLGIIELVGKGSSKFSGSIASRVHNVGVASSKFNGVLIPPGEIFSFNTILGDVSTFTGYKQAYIIKDGKTVLGDGGGVCQVSTTLFRAVLNAGLQVVDRKAHSYRVSYYEQDSSPGLDATVFDPVTDFKFKNDTPGHLLLQTAFDPKRYTLVFEIYGTKDGRISTITKPIVTGVTAPPEDLYTDDPTLPIGTVKQVDFKAWGSKVTFAYKVEKDGVVIFEKTFVSNYRPWQAKFLRGTAPVN